MMLNVPKNLILCLSIVVQSDHNILKRPYYPPAAGARRRRVYIIQPPNFGMVEYYGLCQLYRECGHLFVWVYMLRGVTKQRDVEMIAIHISIHTDCISVAGTQESKSAAYPFHLTRCSRMPRLTPCPVFYLLYVVCFVTRRGTNSSL